MTEKNLYAGPDFRVPEPKPNPEDGSYNIDIQTMGFESFGTGRVQGDAATRALENAERVAATASPTMDRATLQELARGQG